jgi:8-oxo-dGTP pyrophosphatase MutT (NUDIX family)
MSEKIEMAAAALRQAMAKGLPGISAQMRMAPGNRPAVDPNNPSDYRMSAVCIALYEKNERICFPLIQRREYAGHHSGQVSLPGGKFDEQDGSFAQTALRECGEEIGLRDLEIIGALSPLHIPVSLFLVHPFVAVCKISSPKLTSHEREVQAILEIPVEMILDPSIRGRGEVIAGGRKLIAPWFELEGRKVWGATAMILSEFGELCAERQYAF